MPNYDYMCFACDFVKEITCSIANKPDRIPCDKCGEQCRSVILTLPVQLKTLIPMYPGSLKHKAGYVHTHGDALGNKVQVGYGGKINYSESTVNNPVSKGIWENPIRD